MFQPSDIAKLVHVYLKDEGYSRTCNVFESECQLIDGRMDLSIGRVGKLGANLTSILNDFVTMKETDMELDQKETVSVLQSLWKQLDSLIAQLKYASLKGNIQSGQRSKFSQSARSKLAARSREPAFYRIKTTEFKGNTHTRSPAIPQMQKLVLKEVDDQQSGPNKSTSEIVSSGNKSEPSSLCIDGLSNSRGSIPKAMSSQDGVLPTVRNSHKGNHVHSVVTLPGVQGALSNHQVPFVPPTPGSFLLQKTVQLLGETPNTAIANMPVEAVGNRYSVPSCSNQVTSNSAFTPVRMQDHFGSVASTPFTPLRMQDHSGSVPSTPFNTYQKNIIDTSDHPPTPGTFLMPQENLNQTTFHSRPQNADASNKMPVTQPETFSVKTPNSVMSTTAPVTMVTTIDHHSLVGSNVETLESASVAMETTNGQHPQDISNNQRMAISKTPVYEQHVPSQESLEQTCQSSFVHPGYRCEVVDEGHSDVLVSEHLEQEDMLKHQGAAEATDPKSEQIKGKVTSFSDLASPEKRDFGVGDVCVTELQLRSPRRKCPQPKKRSATTESPAKFVDAGQKSSSKADLSTGMSEYGNIAVPAILETLLGTPSLQEKLAENINKVVSRHEDPNTADRTIVEDVPEPIDESQSSDVPVDDILASLQDDPAFEALFTTDLLGYKEESDITEKTDISHNELNFTTLVPTETSSQPVNQSTVSDSATVVSNALLLLSSSPGNKCYQSQPEYISNESKTVTLPSLTESASTTGQLGVDLEATSSMFVPVSSTTSDYGLMIPSTVNSHLCSHKVNVTPRVMARVTTNTKRSSQPSPIKSHVRSLNFGNVVMEKSPRKRKSHGKLQLSSAVVRKTKNSDVVQAALHLANQQANINSPAVKKGRSFVRQPNLTSGRNVPHLTDTSQSNESPKSTISVEAIQSENDVLIGTSATATVTSIAQGNHHVTQLRGRSQAPQSEVVVHPTPFQTTPNIVTNQDAENTTVVNRTGVPLQSAPGRIHVVPHGNQSGFYTNTDLLGMQSSPNVFHRNSLPQSCQTTTIQSVISNSVPDTHCTNLGLQSFQPITASISSKVSEESKHIASSQPFTMARSSNVNLPVVSNREISSSNNGSMLKALQLTAEQDAKSFFVSSGKSSMLSVSDYNTAEQPSGQITGTKIDNDSLESVSLLQLGSQVQEVGNVSNLRPISSLSSLLVANESQIPVTFSQCMPEKHDLQGAVSVTNATIPQLLTVTTDEKLRFSTSNHSLPTEKTNSLTCSKPLSNNAALTTTAQLLKSSRVSSQTINHLSNHEQRGNNNFAVVTADTDYRERSKNQQCNNASEIESDGARDLKSPVEVAVVDSPASSYCSEISVLTPDSNEGKPSRLSGKRSRSTTPENKKKKSKHSKASKKTKKKLSTEIPRNLENLDVDKFLSKLHYIEK